MVLLSVSRRPRYLVGVLGVIAVGLGGLFMLSNRERERTEDGPPAKPGFRDLAEEAGIDFRMEFLPDEQGENFKINLYDHGCGVAVGDVDGDGFEDIYFTNQLGTNRLYRNKGDGTFEDITEKAGVGLGDRVCVAATLADYDNDGFPDLYVTSTRGGNVLFHNKGKDKDGKWLGFEDVTKKAGVECIKHSQTAVFFDFDNDGLLDLFVTNSAGWTLPDSQGARHHPPGVPGVGELATAPLELNILFRNKGKDRDGKWLGFEDVTEKMGVKGKGWGGDVAVFDYNHDGWQDLFVTNMFGVSQLYRNDQGKGFTDVTKSVLGKTSFGAIGCKVFDFNNDGVLDLFIADMHSDMWMDPRDTYELENFGPGLRTKFAFKNRFVLEAFRVKFDEVLFGNTMFKGSKEGKFEELSDRAGMETFWPWGVATGDFDNDGYEDVFIPSGMGYPYGYCANALMMNNGNETFTDRAKEFGVEPPRRGKFLEKKISGQPAARSSRCAAVGDFTNSGRLDIITNNFNDRPYFLRNEFPQKNYLSFKLTGTQSNRDAVGALVKLYMGKEIMVRQVQAAGGYLSHSSQVVHFGLGDRTKVDRAEIVWPRGKVQLIENPAINQRLKITEAAK